MRELEVLKLPSFPLYDPKKVSYDIIKHEIVYDKEEVLIYYWSFENNSIVGKLKENDDAFLTTIIYKDTLNSNFIKKLKEFKEFFVIPYANFIKNKQVDIFDFEKYKSEFNMFKKYFTGTELYLRTAIYIEYKYIFIVNTSKNLEEDYASLENETSKKDLKNLTDLFDPISLLKSWYKHYNPDLVENVEEVFEKYSKKDQIYDLFNKLYRKYVDPDWNIHKELWF